MPGGDAPPGRRWWSAVAAAAARARFRGGDTPTPPAQPASGHGFGVGLLLLAVTLPAMGPAARAESMSVQGATVIEVTLQGGEAWGLLVEFARSVPGREPDYTWSGVTDISGRLVLTIPATDPSMVSGDYRARAVNLYGEVVGEWHRIPVDRGGRQVYELDIGSGQVRRLSAEPENALVAHYRLDGDARDASGNAYHGTPSGVEPGEDRFGNEAGALVFRGTQDRIDLPHQVLDGLRDVSISLWLKTTKSQSQSILSAANRSEDNEHMVYLWDQSNLHFFSHGEHGGNNRFCWVSIPAIADGQWHHIVVIRNASEGNADIYVDGVGQTDLCGSLEYRALNVEAGGLILGQDQDRLGGDFDPNQVLEGSLDDLWIYDRALTASEVQALRGMVEPGAAGQAALGASDSSGLEPNAPNPFNNSTWVPYRLAAPGPVRLEIHNMLGQRVRLLVDEFQAAGSHRVHWDARDQGGVPVAAGVYLARLAHPEGVHSRRLLYLE